MQKILSIIIALFLLQICNSQPLMNDTTSFSLTIINGKQAAAEGVSIELFSASKKALLKTLLTDTKGIAVFKNIPSGDHYFTLSGMGYQSQTTPVFTFPLAPDTQSKLVFQLLPQVSEMKNVTVVGAKPYLQNLQGKVIINVDAAVTNAGTTVLEVLEKSPGVMVDKNGYHQPASQAGRACDDR
ncbi:MAG: hypothetical protein ABIN01_22250 [Ferruginibacter sp.]